jgi:hypothetical protein
MIHYFKRRIDIPMADIVMYECDQCKTREEASLLKNYTQESCENMPPDGWISTATYPLPPFRTLALKCFCSPKCLITYYSPKNA